MIAKTDLICGRKNKQIPKIIVKNPKIREINPKTFARILF